MKTRINSIIRVVSIFLDVLLDDLHRFFYGIPNLKKCQITGSLFLGSQYTKAGLKKLKALGITAIVNMRTHNVYVHCRQGLGRGPTMALAYLMKSGLTFRDAFALVKRVRNFINPKPEQITRLKEFEVYCRKH